SWLEALQNQNFFLPCSYHESAKKNEKNVCCLDCCISICPHCVPAHRSHRLLQVRRYVYHEVVRLEDLQRLVDCSNVQAYTINSAKVVFIKKRPQNRQFKGSGNYCTSCDRSLQEPFIHCSLACKVDFVMKHYKDLSPFLKKCKTLTLGPDFLIPQDIMGDEDMTNHSTIVDSDEPMSWSSASAHSRSSSSSSGSENMSNMAAATCTNKIVRKKRSGLVYVWSRSSTNNYDHDHDHNNGKVSDEDMATSMSRRKGVPQRSPMC
ncbi:Protein RGF1 INDUCIBLE TRANSCRIPTION FACTOR 1, partial [Linum perenne]